METITCVCGFEILVVPDVEAMKKAISNHVSLHVSCQKDVVENNLLKQLFETIGEENV